MLNKQPAQICAPFFHVLWIFCPELSQRLMASYQQNKPHNSDLLAFAYYAYSGVLGLEDGFINVGGPVSMYYLH